MTDRRNIEYRTDMDSSGFDRGARSVRDRFRDMGRAFQENGIVGLSQFSQMLGISGRDIAGWAVKLGEGALDAVKHGLTIERTAQSFREVFTTSSGDMQDSLRELRRSMGLSKSDMEKLLTPLGLMATNAGFAADEAGELAGNLFEMAGDLAIFNPAVGDAETALADMQSALRGEFDPLEKWGIKLSAARIKSEALRLKGIDPVNAALSDQQLEILAVESLIRQNMGPALGALQSQMGTTEDKIRIAESAFEDARDSAYRLTSLLAGPAAADLANFATETADAAEDGNLLELAWRGVSTVMEGLTGGGFASPASWLNGQGDAAGYAKDELDKMAEEYRTKVIPVLQDTRRELSLTKEELEAMTRKSEEFRSRAEVAFSNVQAAWDRMQLTPKRATLDIVSIGIGDDRPVGIGAPEYDGRATSTNTSSWDAVNGGPL